MKAQFHITGCEGYSKDSKKREWREINATPKGKPGRNGSILNRPLSC